MPGPTDTFLIFPNLAAAQARSQQLATRLGCDGVNTVFWYAQIQLTDGTAALVINASGDFDSTPGPTALSQLTPSEITALVPFSTVQPLLSVVSPQAV
jgi:hypothetical protein